MRIRRRTLHISRGKAALLVLAVFVCGAPGRLFGEQPRDRQTKLGSLEKSLLLPGWGQAAEGRVVKGAALLAAELACLAGAVFQNHRGNEAYDLYRAATDSASASRYRGLVERHDGRRNGFLLAAAAVWAVNLVDIYAIVARKGDRSESPALSLGISHAAPREIRLSLGYRF